MSSGGAKKWRFSNPFISSCGCRPTATDAIEPKLKTEKRRRRRRRASSSVSSTTLSPHTGSSQKMISPCPKINDSLAVAKDSDDPYGDFRQSMLEMILEKDIYSRSDLQQLLRCFLDLNPPNHHHTILQAFFDLWNAAALVVDETTPPSCSA